MDNTTTIYCSKLKSIKNITPSYIYGQRALQLTDSRSLVASGTQLVHLDVHFPSTIEKKQTKTVGIPAPIHIDEHVKETLVDSRLTREIQSLTCNYNHTQSLAVIDSKGNISRFELNENQSEAESNQPLIYQYGIPTTMRLGQEEGWAGVSIDPNQSNVTASCRYFDKKLVLHDGDKLTRTIQLSNNPTAISYIYNSNKPTDSLIAVIEQNQLDIIDPRVNDNPIIQKFAPSTNIQYAIGWNDKYIAIGGQDRNLHVYDTQRWSNIGNWSGCLKYEISGIQFSNTNSRVCYLSGLDSEILAGNWDGTNGSDHFSGLRVDSRWLGVSKQKNKESLFGFTATGSLYWVHDSIKLYVEKTPTTVSNNSRQKQQPQTPKEKKEKKQAKKEDTQQQDKGTTKKHMNEEDQNTDTNDHPLKRIKPDN